MMKRIAMGLALIAIAGAAQATVLTTGLVGTPSGPLKAGEMLYERPATSFGGQHFRNSLGCIYSRTQAPGYPVVWHLQVNTRVVGCPNTIPGA